MKNIITILLLLTSIIALRAQQVDLENVGDIANKKPLKITGGLAANSVLYGGNENYNRDFWNYFLSGSINFSIYELLDLPFSFNLTNSGANMAYPTLPNRFSLHPTYKWISAHIGDVAMTFSPYTLNGHQFTGAGVDLTPGDWKISAMAGRLQRSVAYDTLNPYSFPYYQRMGYGTKVRCEREKYKIGVIGFFAKDNASSIAPPPDSLNVVPQQNLVLSGDVSVQLLQNLSLMAEYAHSILTDNAHDITQNFNAFKVGFNWQLWKNSIGITYEYVGPNYATLGAYYFNNDFENITLNYARPLFNDKLNVALNFGIQQDDLSSQNNSKTNRYVSSVNISYVPSERINAHVSYSNFQSHTNIKSPFDYINQTLPTENLDTLNFSQLSQNAGVMLNFSFGKSGKDVIRHQLSFNLNFQEAVSKHGDIAYIGDITRFYTFATTYGLQFPKGIQLISAFNISYNDMGISNQLTVGPSVGVSGHFLEKTLSVGILTSYNTNFADGNAQNNIANIRGNIGCRLWKHHQLTANCIYQLRSYTGKDNTHGITATIGYAYNF
ncbi:MAG: hypothetical protein FWH23_07340 [Bacteroidales bacterium]|nr:hypothetical protein [Bacteroidales bacterium]